MVGNNEGSLMTGVKFPNVLGRGEKLQADYTYGTKKTSNFNISLVKPLRGKLKTNLTGNIYQSNGEYQQSGFKELDRGLLADLAFRSAPNVSHNLQYEAVWRNISSLNRAAAFSVREHSGDCEDCGQAKISLNLQDILSSQLLGTFCVWTEEMTRYFPRRELCSNSIKNSQASGVMLVSSKMSWSFRPICLLLKTSHYKEPLTLDY